MHKGKDRQLWWHTAAVMANAANCHIDPKKRPKGFTPRDFHPYERTRTTNGMPVRKDTMGAFVAMFVPPEKAKQAEEKAKANKAAADLMAAKLRQRMVYHASN